MRNPANLINQTLLYRALSNTAGHKLNSRELPASLPYALISLDANMKKAKHKQTNSIYFPRAKMHLWPEREPQIQNRDCFSSLCGAASVLKLSEDCLSSKKNCVYSECELLHLMVMWLNVQRVTAALKRADRRAAFSPCHYRKITLLLPSAWRSPQ